MLLIFFQPSVPFIFSHTPENVCELSQITIQSVYTPPENMSIRQREAERGRERLDSVKMSSDALCMAIGRY